MKMRFLIFICLFSAIFIRSSDAFWMWTPETNKWENPKYAVKETPKDQLDFALGFYEAKKYKEAVRELNKLLNHYPRAKEAPDAQYYIAKSYEDQNQLYQAFKQYQTVIDKYPFSERSGEIVKLQFDLGVRMLEGKAKNESWMSELQGADYNIVDIFRAVIKNAPYGPYAAASQYKIGLYLLENNLYQEARDEFEKLVNDYPDSEWAKAAKYQIALSDAKRSTEPQYDQKITQSAVKEFEHFAETNPEAELSDDAKKQIATLREKEAENAFIVAQFYEKQKNYSAAKIYYQSVVDDYETSSFASKALEKIREMNLKARQ
jgi:outer membrane protein assembly factor BamD